MKERDRLLKLLSKTVRNLFLGLQVNKQIGQRLVTARFAVLRERLIPAVVLVEMFVLTFTNVVVTLRTGGQGTLRLENGHHVLSCLLVLVVNHSFLPIFSSIFGSFHTGRSITRICGCTGGSTHCGW